MKTWVPITLSRKTATARRALTALFPSCLPKPPTAEVLTSQEIIISATYTSRFIPIISPKKIVEQKFFLNYQVSALHPNLAFCLCTSQTIAHFQNNTRFSLIYLLKLSTTYPKFPPSLKYIKKPNTQISNVNHFLKCLQNSCRT